MTQSAKAHEPVQSLLWEYLLDKPVAVEFAAERQTDNAGLLLPAAVDRHWRLTARIAAGLRDSAVAGGYGGCASPPILRFRLRYLGSFIWLLLQPKAVLSARILALQSQLAVCKHRIEAGKAPQPRFNQAFRILWVILSKLLDRWEDLAKLMKPVTVKKWHATAFRLFWRWKSKPGRPEIEPEMQALIRKLSAENPLGRGAHPPAT